jgi:hypothetical protein
MAIITIEFSDCDGRDLPGPMHSGLVQISVGHDEYWSWDMRNNIEAARLCNRVACSYLRAVSRIRMLNPATLGTARIELRLPIAEFQTWDFPREQFSGEPNSIRSPVVGHLQERARAY